MTTTNRYRHALPQLAGQPMLTDSGLETTLIFLDGLDLPCFASFSLLATAEGTARLRAYYDRHIKLAVSRGMGFIADTPTWRANRDWGVRLGYDDERLNAINRSAVAMMFDIRETWERSPDGSSIPIIVSGNIGPRDDGYSPNQLMEPDEAEAYHTAQVRTFADAGVDMITAMTMTHVGEAIGIARATKAAGIPLSMGLTVETDGRLPTGQSLADAIEDIDACGAKPAYYMINCAHPDHFRNTLAVAAEGGGDGSWRDRILAIRANASRKSHAELDEATELDAGDPIGLGHDYMVLWSFLPNLRVLGGCCGTDHRHIIAIADAYLSR
jgi:homocysteine S-methyltransferase